MIPRSTSAALVAAALAAGCTTLLGVDHDYHLAPEATGGAGQGGAGQGGAGGMGGGGSSSDGGGSAVSVGVGGAGGSGGQIWLTDQTSVDSIVIDGDHVYWIAGAGSTSAWVQRASRTGDGSDRQNVFTPSNVALKQIDVANEILAATDGVMVDRHPLGNPPGTTPGQWTPSQGHPVTGIAVDPYRIYFIGRIRIYWVLHEESTAEVVEYETPAFFDVASNATNVYWTVESDVDGLQVAWQPHGIDPQNGGLDVTGTPDRIAADDQHVCWTEQNPNSVGCLSVTTGTLTNSVDLGASTASSIVVHDGHVYWTERGAGRVMRASVDGDNVTTLSDSEPDPSSIAVDADHVFWTNPSAHTIMRMPIP